jgi:hypothetical protein
VAAPRIFLRRARHTVVSPRLKRNLSSRQPFCTAATNFDIAAGCTELVCFIVHGNYKLYKQRYIICCYSLCWTLWFLYRAL